MKELIKEGGDADTNGSIVGSMLGSKFGYNKIPKELIKGLKGAEELEIKLVDT
ncbi:MAG: ADP-ribosylglycohydrolase [Saprospiraceae bacterium]|jgi:ADP-ribosylglycohydrolase